jgi:hypothetical protein
MLKFKNVGLTVLSTGLALFIAGCSGGSNSGLGGSSSPSVDRFSGNYTGAFLGISFGTFSDSNGVFSNTVNSDGVISGTVTQDNGIPASALSGTISNSGAIRATTGGSIPVSPPITFESVLQGTASGTNSDRTISGTLLTTQSNGSSVRGGFVGIRSTSNSSAFAGTYNGSLTGKFTQDGTALQGTLTLNVSRNGLIRGSYARNVANPDVRSVAGTIDSAGDFQLFFLSLTETTPGSGVATLVQTRFNGKGTTGTTPKITGTFSRTGTADVAASGTFSLTRSSATATTKAEVKQVVSAPSASSDRS